MMTPFAARAPALMLRLAIATIIGVTLGLCSLEQAMHVTKKALIGVIDMVKHPEGARNDSRRPGLRP